MAIFLADMIKKGYAQDEVFAILFESEQERKRTRMQAIVIETVGAHRLQKMRDLLAFEKLATWRRVNGFDRIAADDNQRASRPLPLTPDQFTQSLWSEVNALKYAISMPVEDTVTRLWQKTIDFVDGLKGKLPEEELAEISGTWKSGVARRHRIPYSTVVAPVRLISNLRQVHMTSWKSPWVRWAWSWRSSNQHQLVRVSRRPDSSVL